MICFKQLAKQFLFFTSYLFQKSKDSKVVYYHDVGTKYTYMGTDFGIMRKHLEIIRQSGYAIVPSIEKRKGQMMICFDDGWAGIYDHKDFFIEEGIRPTIFVAVDLIDKEGYLTHEQIRELQKLGFLFECHTWSHQDLTSFSDDELIHELKDSKEKLDSILNKKITDICYPKGRFSNAIFKFCIQCGYRLQYSSIPGNFFDLYEYKIICRNCAQFLSPIVFKWMINSHAPSLLRKRLIKQQYKN